MLELRQISVDVDGNHEILRGINLTIGDGRFVAITGPNGGGKSTLARVIAGITAPISGTLLLDRISHRNRLPTAHSLVLDLPFSSLCALRG